jgi:hypothetical protein
MCRIKSAHRIDQRQFPGEDEGAVFESHASLPSIADWRFQQQQRSGVIERERSHGFVGSLMPTRNIGGSSFSLGSSVLTFRFCPSIEEGLSR